MDPVPVHRDVFPGFGKLGRLFLDAGVVKRGAPLVWKAPAQEPQRVQKRKRGKRG